MKVFFPRVNGRLQVKHHFIKLRGTNEKEAAGRQDEWMACASEQSEMKLCEQKCAHFVCCV